MACWRKTGADHIVPVFSYPRCRWFPFAVLRYRCQDAVPTPTLCHPPRTQTLPAAPWVTQRVRMLSIMTWCKVLRMGEGGFSTSGSCCAICARWEVFTEDEGSYQMCPTNNLVWLTFSPAQLLVGSEKRWSDSNLKSIICLIIIMPCDQWS